MIKKKLLILILALMPVMLCAQVNLEKTKLSDGVQDSVLGTDIVLKNNEIIFQKTYSSELSKSELIEKLKTYLPTIKNFQLSEVPNQNIDQFSGRLTDYIVNYRKYGGTLMGTSIALNYPLNANAIIQVKDFKYRITISNFIFKGIVLMSQKYDLVLDDALTKSKRTKIRNNQEILNAAIYLNKELNDMFDINNTKKIDDF